MLPGAVWRSDGWNGTFRPTASPAGGHRAPLARTPAGRHFPENPQNGQPRLPAGEGRTAAGVTKRQRIEEYLDGSLRTTSEPDRAGDHQRPAKKGLEVTERYVKQSSTSEGQHPRPGGGGVAPVAPADDRDKTAPASDQGPPAAGARTRPAATPQPGSRGGRARGGPGRRAVAGRGRRPARGGRLLPASPSDHLAGPAPVGRSR